MSEQEYYELMTITEEAADRLYSGEGRSGVHYELIALLKSKHGVLAMSREEAVRAGRKLCDEYVDGLK